MPLGTPPRLVGVRLKRSGRVLYCDAQGLSLQVNDWVVVEGENGPVVGRVVIAPTQVLLAELREPLPPVLRVATEEERPQGMKTERNQ
jgi:cell fate regulator YaaT (PSP1 superfamily)